MPSAKVIGHVRFGIFELDLRTCELRRNGLKLKLQSQPFQLLAALVERPGEIVTRDELRARLWTAGTFIDFDHSLSAAATRLREVLGDSAENPRFIETTGRRGLPNAGYRFIAPVQSAFPRMIRVAVLPFSNLGFDRDNYFLDGLTDEINTRLSLLMPSRLAVIARTSVAASLASRNSPYDIGLQLGADYLLEGTVRSTAGRCRITVQLVKIENHVNACALTFEHDLKDVEDWLALEARVAKEVAQSLSLHLFLGELTSNGRVSSRNGRAYDEYLRGRHHSWTSAEPGFHITNAHYEKAIELDPSFAAPYSGLADNYNLYAMYGTGLNTNMSLADAGHKAEEYARRALEIDSGIAEAHAALGFCHLQYGWNWPAAENEFRQAVDLNPSCVVAHHWYAWGLVQIGWFDEGLARMEKARVLDPLSIPINAHLGWFLYLAGRPEEAIQHLEAAVELHRRIPLTLHSLALAYSRAGRFNDALRAIDNCLACYHAHGLTYSAMVEVYAAANQKEKAVEVLERMRQITSNSIISPYFYALAYASLGDSEQCFTSLGHAIREKSGWIPHMRVEPVFNRVRSDPRWTHLVALAGVNYGSSTHTEA